LRSDVFPDLRNRRNRLGDNDVDACEILVKEAGVAAVPVSAFYGSDAPTGFIRFCFCKHDAVIDEALERLLRFLTAARAESA
jgi:N-succinyldiaminopimelate aminotransferase